MEHSNHHNDSGRRSSLVGAARAVLKQNPTLDGETHLPGGVVGRRSSNSVDLSSPLSTSLNRVPVQIDEGQSSHRRLSTLGGASGENSNRRLSTMSNAAGFSSTVTTVMNVQNFSQKLRRASMEAASSIFEASTVGMRMFFKYSFRLIWRPKFKKTRPSFPCFSLPIICRSCIRFSLGTLPETISVARFLTSKTRS